MLLKTKYLLASAMAVGLTLSGCSDAGGAMDNSKINQSVYSVSDAERDLYAFNDDFNAISGRHDLDGLLSLYVPDALWIAPGERPVAGYDAPRQTFGFLTSNKGVLTHTIDHLKISDDATQAVMIGEAIIQVPSAGLDATGTYLFVMKRVNGEWKVVTDMFHQHTKP